MIFTDWSLYPRGPILSPVLNENSWEQISEASSKGQGQNYWSVGDCKKVHVEGIIGVDPSGYFNGSELNINQDLYVFIIGFDHNSQIEGPGITFQCFKREENNEVNVLYDVALIDDYYDINRDGWYFNIIHESTSASDIKDYPGLGWKYSDVRHDILGSTDVKWGDASVNTAITPVANTLMAALPIDLRSVMKPMSIYSNTQPHADESLPTVIQSVDYLPLLAAFEAGEDDSSEESEYQEMYEYYAVIQDYNEVNYIRNPAKFSFKDGTTPIAYWTRTCVNSFPYYTMFDTADDIAPGDRGGQFKNWPIAGSYGLAPIFRV